MVGIVVRMAEICLLFIVMTGIAFAVDCSQSSIRCVGTGQEYGNIQSAVNDATAGDTVLVMDGSYSGFSISRSGTSANPITIRANGNAAIINKGGKEESGIFISDSSHLILEGFQIQDVSGRCIAARNASPTSPMTDVTIRNNICQRSGRDGFYVSELSNSLIENNFISATGLAGSAGGFESHGIYLANAGSKNTIIRGNTIIRDSFYASYSGCIHINGDLSVGGDGIISGLIIEKNQLIGCYDNGINMDGVQNSVIRNNLIYDSGRHSLRGYKIDGSKGPQYLQIYNNTFIVSSGSDSWAIKLTADMGGHTIFNNILLNEGSNGGSICVSNSNLYSNYNIVGNRMSRDGEKSIISLSSWKSQTGQDDTTSISTSIDLFADPINNDYHLKNSSPAINRGIAIYNSVNAATVDLDEIQRPQGAVYDIGAYEKTEDVSPPSSPTNLRITG